MEKPKMPPSGASAESIVWRQFKKRRMGLYSLYGILVLFAVAIYAPLLANDKPLALYTTYADVYDYSFAGWVRVHDTLADSLARREQLQAELRAAEAGFEQEKTALRGLYDQLTSIGDQYDELRSR